MNKQIENALPVSRRSFLRNTSIASGGLALGLSLPGCATRTSQMTSDGDWVANAWLELDASGNVTFTLDRVEMGQGTYTGLTTLIAEELDLAPEAIKVQFAEADPVYRNRGYGLQITGGSNSIASSWEHIRSAAAAAREMLITAAADVWNVSPQSLRMSEGEISTADGTQTIAVGELVALAAKGRVPDTPALKDKSEFKYIGKHNRRLDSGLKVTGSATFGIDVEIENMVYAVMVRPPAIGAKLSGHNGAQLTEQKGYIAITEVDSGLAVVASSYWAAKNIAEQVKAEWTMPEQLVTSELVSETLRSVVDENDGSVVREVGDVEDAFASASQIVELEFEFPYLAHATMEPMNCVAHVQEHRADVWASTQAPDVAQVVVAKATHLSLDEVHVHTQFLGGGFGRRLNQDFIGEAAEISANIGLPVKLVWSREEDMRNDFYRPASAHRLKAALNDKGQLTGWQHHIAAQGVMDWYVWDAGPAMFPFMPKFMYPMLGHMGLATAGTPMTPADRSAYEGADDLEYEFESQEISHSKVEFDIPVGYWRSVGHSHNGFVTEIFMDHCAEQAGRDAVEFRLSLLEQHPRLAGVLKLAAQKGGWNETPPVGRFRGIATHKSFGSYVAELVELSVANNEIQIHKVVCAVDCGTVVNPDVVTMQMESGIVFGLTAALYGEITFKEGMAEQSNFHDYPMLRYHQCPEIEVHIVDSDELPTGVGEPSVPPLAAALGSALYKATGKRITSLPFKLA